MKILMQRAAINVVENNNILGYICSHTASDLPVYYPPRNRTHYFHNESIEDCIFLPITEEQFQTERNKYLYGYRFIFYSAGTMSVGLQGNPWVPSFSHIEMREEVRRIQYHIDDNDRVIISQMFDPLVPPQWYNFETRTSVIGEYIVEAMKRIIDSYTSYYVDKTI